MTWALAETLGDVLVLIPVGYAVYNLWYGRILELRANLPKNANAKNILMARAATKNIGASLSALVPLFCLSVGIVGQAVVGIRTIFGLS